MRKNQKNSFLKDYNPQAVLAFAVDVYKQQGFVRSNEGYAVFDDEGNQTGFVNDNKTCIIHLMESKAQPSDQSLDVAKKIIEKFNGKLMVKKLTGKLTSFEKSVSDSFVNELSPFTVAVIASIPHMNEVDKKRSAIDDKLEQLKFTSEYFGEPKQRYDIEVEVLDVKFIQSSGIYMITTIYGDKHVIKFWWRDQPDLSDLIDGKRIHIRGTVNRHEIGKYSGCQETLMNRVKILKSIK